MKSQWILTSALMGIVAAILFLLAYTIRSTAWILTTIVFIATFLFFIFRNPAFWYRRMAASMILAWITSTFIPIKSFTAVLKHYGANLEAEFPQPTTSYHIGFMFIITVLLVLDFLMRMKQLSPTSKRDSYTGPPQDETMEKVKATVLAIIERSSITEKQKEKLVDDIDFTISQIQNHLGTTRSGTSALTLLSPLNTAVRPPFVFDWKVDQQFIAKNELSETPFKLIIRRMDNSEVVFETSTTNSTLQAPDDLVQRLEPDVSYTWDIQVFDQKNELLLGSDSTPAIKHYNTFQLFSQNSTLDALLKEHKRDDSSTNHVAIALILEKFDLKDEALTALHKALTIDPANEYADNRRKRILDAQGKSFE